MRLLHVIPAVAPCYGGPSQVAVRTLRALLACGVEALLLTTDADGRGRLAVETGRTAPYEGVPTLFFPRQWSEAFKYSYPLARWLDTNVPSFDVVHIDAVFSHSSLAAARACRRHAVPYVVRPLGSLGDWSLTHKRWRKRLFWRLGAERMLRGAAALHYTTEREKRLAEAVVVGGRGIVVPPGVDVRSAAEEVAAGAFRRALPALGKDPYVLVLSRLHPVKGIELLIEAFLDPTLAETTGGWKLVLAGNGDPAYVERLRMLVRRHGGETRILFPGWLVDALKVAAIREASLLALTSHHENFGLCVVEALACGVPVLVSDRVGLATEVAEAGAGWVTTLAPGAIRSALSAALSEDSERTARGEAGRRLVTERFTWTSVAERLLDLYRRAADGKRKGG